MATVQELYKDYADLEVKVKDVRGKLRGATEKKIAQAEKDIIDAQTRVQSCQNKVTELEGYRSPYLSKAGSKKLENDIQQAQADLQQAQADLQNAQNIKDAMNVPELSNELATLQSQMDDILNQFAVDPIINSSLQVSIRAKFETKIRTNSESLEESKKQQADFNAALTDDAGLKAQVEKLQKAEADLQKVAGYATSLDPNKYQEFVNAVTARNDAIVELRAVSKTKFKDIEISDDMVTTISSGTVSTYIFEPLKPIITSKEKEGKNLEESRDKAIQRLQNIMILGKSTVDVSALDAQIKAEEAKLPGLDAEVKKQDDELQKVQDAEKDLPDRQKELADLEAKAGTVDPKIQSEHDKAKKQYDEEMKKVTDKGYITSSLVDSLEVRQLYSEFEKADLALRKAFLTVEGDPSDKAKGDLKAAISNYRKVSSDLATKSGFKVEDWNDFLKRSLNDKISNGETIDEAYYSNTSKDRLDAIGKKYKISNGYIGMIEVAQRLESMEKLKQDILLGPGKVEEADIDKALNAYNTSMKSLSNHAGVNDLSEFMSNMKNKVAQKVHKIFKFLDKPKKQKPLEVKSYDSEAIASAKKITEKNGLSDKLKGAKQKLDNSSKGTLTPNEATRKTELETTVIPTLKAIIGTKTAVETAHKKAHDAKTAAEANITNLNAQRTQALSSSGKGLEGVSNPEVGLQYRKDANALRKGILDREDREDR